MDPFVRNFLRASVTWLVVGGGAGLAMAIRPNWTVYRAAHAHLVLMGFVAMMIFGVGYHVIPRFAGAPIRDRRWPTAHWWVANAGLVLMFAGFLLRGSGVEPAATWLLTGGGLLSGAGMLVFAFVVRDTLGRSPLTQRARPVSEAPPLKSRPLPMQPDGDS